MISYNFSKLNQILIYNYFTNLKSFINLIKTKKTAIHISVYNCLNTVYDYFFCFLLSKQFFSSYPSSLYVTSCFFPKINPFLYKFFFYLWWQALKDLLIFHGCHWCSFHKDKKFPMYPIFP